MSQDVQAIREDLAFMRALASEGRRAPLLYGSVLLAAGLIYTAASLCAWAIASGVILAPAVWQMGAWLVASAVFVPVLVMFIKGSKTKPGSTALTNRAVALGWSALGWVIFAMFIACAVVSWETSSPAPWSIFPSLVLAVYGGAWMMSAGMSGLKWIRAISAGCFVSAAGVAFLAQRAEIFLAYSAALLLLVALPGWLLMRAEPPETV